MKQFTKEMSIEEALKNHSQAFQVFTRHGMHCISCMVGNIESIEQAAIIHGINIDDLLAELNELLKNRD